MHSRNKMVLLEYIASYVAIYHHFYPTIIWNFIFEKVATRLDEEYFVALIGFTWCHKASIQFFVLGTLPGWRGPILNIVQICIIFPQQKHYWLTFWVQKYLMCMPMILCKSGCGLWSVEKIAYLAIMKWSEIMKLS